MWVAKSLRLRTAYASELMGILLKSDTASGLAKVIKEVRRINRTLYLLDSQEYRRRILNQLNLGNQHSITRAICYGKPEEIRKRYKAGQENQLGALELVIL